MTDSQNSRDNFTKTTVDILGRRVGYLCSKPDCRKHTVGSNTIDNKATSLGEAAHITAASPGGTRYNPDLTPEQRSDISNGIWLCCNCATLIDKDHLKFPVELLHEWKKDAELESSQRLEGKGNATYIAVPILEADLLGWGRSRVPMCISNKNPIEIHDGKEVIVAGSKPIIHWSLTWRYDFVIHNNSTVPAINVKIESIGKIHFTDFQKPNDVNSIPPLHNLSLKVKYECMIEGAHTVADEMKKPRFPDLFKDMILRLTYLDERRNEHVSYVEFVDGTMINRKA
jgi:hypothetical protein